MMPGLGISMSRDGKNFVIVNQVESQQWGCVEEYGPLVHVTYDEMQSNGLAIVQRSLGEYPTRKKTEKSELEAMPTSAQKKFEREHKHVGVSLQNGSEIWIDPIHFGKRGMIGGTKPERQILRLPTTQDTFFKALLEAFRVAD